MNIIRKKLTTAVASLLALTMVANLTACGALLHPERNGQRAGQVDLAIVILDGLGLLFFTIPGIVAFAVDFTTHTIYLPHGHSSGRYTQFQFEENLDAATIENFIHTQTGANIDLQQSNVEIVKLESIADLDYQFALHGADNRIALAQ